MNNDCHKKCQQPTPVLGTNERKTLALVVQLDEEGIPSTIKDITAKLKITSRQAYYATGKLQEKGLIDNMSEGVWLLTPTQKGKDVIEALIGATSKTPASYRFLDRGHRILLTCKIDYRPPNVIPPGYKASKKSHKLNWVMPQLNKNSEEERVSVQITPKTLSINFREVYGMTPHDVVHRCINHSWKYIQELRECGFKLRRPNLVCLMQHHAIASDGLAEWTRKYDVTWKSERIHFDSSVAANEFELVHPEQGPDDFVKVMEFFELIIRENIRSEDIMELQGMLPQLRQYVSQVQCEVENVRRDNS